MRRYRLSSYSTVISNYFFSNPRTALLNYTLHIILYNIQYTIYNRILRRILSQNSFLSLTLFYSLLIQSTILHRDPAAHMWGTQDHSICTRFYSIFPYDFYHLCCVQYVLYTVLCMYNVRTLYTRNPGGKHFNPVVKIYLPICILHIYSIIITSVNI